MNSVCLNIYPLLDGEENGSLKREVKRKQGEVTPSLTILLAPFSTGITVPVGIPFPSC